MSFPGVWEEMLASRLENKFTSPKKSWIEILDVVSDFFQDTGYTLNSYSKEIKGFPIVGTANKNFTQKGLEDNFAQEIIPLFPQHKMILKDNKSLGFILRIVGQKKQ